VLSSQSALAILTFESIVDKDVVMPVLISPEAQQQFHELPRPTQGRVLRLFERLDRWPEVSGAKPLVGSLAGCFRLRTGDYRILFRVSGNDVIVFRIAHRRKSYGE
jgi:mRNA interferase RelE/StbE